MTAGLPLLGPAHAGMAAIEFLEAGFRSSPADGWPTLEIRRQSEEPAELGAGEVFTLAFSLTNRGEHALRVQDRMDLPEDWQLVLPLAAFTLAPGETRMRLMAVQTGRQGRAGEYFLHYRVEEVDTLRSSPPLQTRVMLRTVLDLQWVPAGTVPNWMLAGESLEVEMRVVNRGNVPLFLHLQAQEDAGFPGVHLRLTPEQVTLAPQASQWVRLSVDTSATLTRAQRLNLLLMAQARPAEATETDRAESVDTGSVTQRHSIRQVVMGRGGPPVVIRHFISVEVLPSRGGEDPFLRLPMEFTAQYRGSADTDSLQFRLSGNGYLDTQGQQRLQLWLRPPDPWGRGGFGQRDEYGLRYTGPHWSLRVGDQAYRLSPLTADGRYGRGLAGDLHAADAGFRMGMHWVEDAFSQRQGHDLAAYLAWKPKDRHHGTQHTTNNTAQYVTQNSTQHTTNHGTQQHTTSGQTASAYAGQVADIAPTAPGTRYASTRMPLPAPDSLLQEIRLNALWMERGTHADEKAYAAGIFSLQGDLRLREVDRLTMEMGRSFLSYRKNMHLPEWSVTPGRLPAELPPDELPPDVLPPDVLVPLSVGAQAWSVEYHGRLGKTTDVRGSARKAEFGYAGPLADTADYAVAMMSPLNAWLQGGIAWRRHERNLQEVLERGPAHREHFYSSGVNLSLPARLNMSMNLEVMEREDALGDPAYATHEKGLRLGLGQGRESMSWRMELRQGQREQPATGQVLQRDSTGFSLRYHPRRTLQLGVAGQWLQETQPLDLSTWRHARQTSLSVDWQPRPEWGGSLRWSHHTQQQTQETVVTRYAREQVSVGVLHRPSPARQWTFELRQMGGPHQAEQWAYGIHLTQFLSVPIRRKPTLSTLTGQLRWESAPGGEPEVPVAHVVLRAGSAVTRTDAAGRFIFHGMTPGEYILQVEDAALGPEVVWAAATSARVALPGGRTTHAELQLTRAAAVAGDITVVREASTDWRWRTHPENPSSPVGNVMVEMWRPEDPASVLRTLSNAEGAFQFQRLAPGTWMLQVHEGTLSRHHQVHNGLQTLELVPGGQEKVQIQVQPRERRMHMIDGGWLRVSP